MTIGGVVAYNDGRLMATIQGNSDAGFGLWGFPVVIQFRKENLFPKNEERERDFFLLLLDL